MCNPEPRIPVRNRNRLLGATQGLELTDHEDAVLSWLAAIWEVETCEAVASVLDKARAANRGPVPDAWVHSHNDGEVFVRVPDRDDPGVGGGVYLNGNCIDHGESGYSPADARRTAAALLRAADLAEDGYGWTRRGSAGQWLCLRWSTLEEQLAGEPVRCGRDITEQPCPRHGTRPPVGPGFVTK